jgi:hypothetical protein
MVGAAVEALQSSGKVEWFLDEQIRICSELKSPASLDNQDTLISSETETSIYEKRGRYHETWSQVSPQNTGEDLGTWSAVAV